MRVECSIEGLTDNFIDVADDWTRGEYRQLSNVTDLEEYLVWFRRKVTGVKLTTATGEYITDPQAVTMDTLDTMSLQLTGFVERALYQACNHLRALGNASGRASSSRTYRMTPARMRFPGCASWSTPETTPAQQTPSTPNPCRPTPPP